ncbi:MAG: ABC transporter permease subunit/CPBP intramembrane protease [Pirellulaceae bacterium]
MNTHPDNSTGDLPVSASRQMTLGRLVRLCRKELRETLRDRRTIVTLVVMPLLIYPLLSITFQTFFLQSLAPGETVNCIVGVEPGESANRLFELLNQGDKWLRENEAARQPAAIPASPLERLTAESPSVEVSWDPVADPRARLADGVIDLAIEFVEDSPAGQQGGEVPAEIRCVLVYRSGSALSRTALEYVESRLQAVNDRFLAEHVEELSGGRLPVWSQPTAVRDEGPPVSLTAMIPLILILMTITGAVYPAIDLTAGERERGTLETLMAAPIPRTGLLLAKYFAVLVVAVLTATANLAAMTATLSVGGMSALLLGDEGLSLLVTVQVFGLMILFAAFFSAVALALTSFARSFKEAQAYLIPLMLMCLAPGVLSLMPGMRLTTTMAILPLLNIVLLAREVLGGTATALPALLAVVSTLLYALAAVSLAARIFGSDGVLYGSQAAWSDLLRRSPERRSAAPLSGALFCLALLFPATFLASGVVSHVAGGWMELAIALSGLALLLVYGVVPGLFAYQQHVEPTSAFRAYPPPLATLAAAVVLGVSLWPIAHELILFGNMIGLGGLSADKFAGARLLLERWRSVNPAIILLALAFAPAMCEEWFFRGYLFSALEKVTRPIGAVLISALLFGVFHVISASVLTTERLLPSTFVGLVLGLVAWRSGSIIPGMLLHMIHNGLALSMMLWSDKLSDLGSPVGESLHLPVLWIAASLVGVAIGTGLLFVSRPPVHAPAVPPSGAEPANLETTSA